MDENAQKDLTIVTVPWNSREVLVQNLETLFQSTGDVAFDVVAVDNASHDGSAELIRERFPQVQVIANAANRGFSAACNQGIALSHARHVLLLNPDMRVTPEALQKTVAYLDAHPEVGVMGAKLIGSDGKTIPHIRRFPTFWDQLATLLKLPHFFPHLLDTYLGKDLDLEKEQFVDSVRGSYFAINRTALDKLGGLDERYFIWFEEVDYCKQVYAAGLKVAYVPSIIAHDLVGRSFAQRDSYWKQKNFTRSMVTYFKKWHAGWRGMVLASVRLLMVGLAWVMDRLK
jgi:GT2 family glycosyltransferase